MGISLNTPIKKPEKAAVYPTKRTINLVPPKEKLTWTPRLIIATIIGAILIALFAKFAVIDVLGMATATNAQLTTKKAELATLQQSNEQYPALQREVARYGAGGLSTDERALVNRAQILDLVSDTIGSRTDVRSVTVKGFTLEIQFVNAALSDVSSVVAAIESSPLVENVAMDNSKHNANSEVISTVTVTLVGGSNAQKAAGASGSTSTNTGVRNG